MPLTTIASDDLEHVVRDALARRGRTDEAARIVAAALVEAERAGTPEFGIGLIVSAPAETDWDAAPCADAGALVTLDAAGRFAPLVLAEASRVAIARATGIGIGAVVVLAPTALGRLSPYVRAIADEGLVGLIAVGSPPLVAPHGGDAAALGTNPVAVAVPASRAPVVLDAASSAVTKGRWSRLRAEGQALPEGVAIDADGAPETDPDLVRALLPRGGVAGTALALVVEALTNGVAGIPGSSQTRRAGLVLALRSLATDTDAAGVGDDLRARLEAAGGHVPGSRTPQHPGPVRVDADLLDALQN